MSVIACWAHIERLLVQTEIAIRIMGAIPDEKSLHVLNQSKEDGSQMWDPQVFDALIKAVNRLWPHDINNVSLLVPFLSAALGQNPDLRARDLTFPEHSPTLTAALETTWSSIYPYIANRIAPSPRLEDDSLISAKVTGQFTQLNKIRIVQNEVSTSILQALLSIIAACVAISFWSMNVRKVLPKNAGSIAAQMSLLAGSDLVNKLSINLERGSHGNGIQYDIFRDKVFSMGWWGNR